MTRSSSGSGWANLVLMLVTLVCLVVGAEFGLRAADSSGLFPGVFTKFGRPIPPMNVRDGESMFYVHPYSVYNLQPGYEKGTFQKINSLGFRGEEIQFEKPDSTYRIVAIGGSTTFAVYLPWYESYPFYLQKDLRERLHTDQIEVINAGLTGSTTAESLHRLFYQVLPVKPDMVIIYHAFNDLFPRVFNNYADDYFHFRRSDSDNSPGMTRFILYRIVMKALNPVPWGTNFDLANIIWKVENLPDSDAKRLENFYTSNSDAFEHNLEYMVVTLQAHGVQPVLATFAMKPDIIHWTDYVPPIAWEEGIRQNNAAIGRVAEKYDVPLVPFAELAADLPTLNMWSKTNGCCYPDSIHMSPEGNVLKAKIFADTIEPIILQSITLD